MNNIPRLGKFSCDRILKGLLRREYKPYYQPQWNVQRRSSDRAEALIRWQFDNKLLLAPVSFLQQISSHSLMPILGYYLIDYICQDLNSRTGNQNPLKKIGINFSYEELVKPGFSKTVRDILQHYQIPTSTFIIEITETSAFTDMGKLEEIVIELKQYGFDFALDDFCTGFSCFNHLDKLPVDALKLDRQFVNKIHFENRHYHICKGVIDIANSLGMEVTAEGIESIEQKELLEILGCHYLQGYYYGKAMPFNQLNHNIPPDKVYFYEFVPLCERNSTGHFAFS